MAATGGADLIDESYQIGVGGWIIEGLAALRLVIAGAADAAEAGDVSSSIHMDCLVLGVLAHPGDDDLVLVSEDQVHAPISVEPPLADVVVVARLGAHACSAGLASTVAKLLNDTLEAFLGLSSQCFDPRLTAACDGDFEPGRHVQAVGRGTHSEFYGVAREGVLQALLRSGLCQRSLISRLA